MGDIKRVVVVDIAVRDVLEVLEDVLLKGVRRFHNKGVGIKPPEPAMVSHHSCWSCNRTYHSA